MKYFLKIRLPIKPGLRTNYQKNLNEITELHSISIYNVGLTNSICIRKTDFVSGIFLKVFLNLANPEYCVLINYRRRPIEGLQFETS